MRGACLCLVVLLFSCVSCGAETVVMEDGTVDVAWEAGVVSAILRIHLDSSDPPAGTTATWVITNSAQRFQNGIYAWQLHFGDDPNVLVIPNDFLMTRRFTFTQLGIEVLAHEHARELVLRIPRDGTIPNLILPGDSMDIHALWLQMEPLTTLSIPSFGEVATAGGGAETEGNPALLAPPSDDPLPEQSIYVVGEPIEHCFVVVDPDTGELNPWATAQCEVVRCSGNRAIIAQFQIPRNSETGAFELLIDTTSYVPGDYDLCIWASTIIVCKRIEIREP